MLEDVVFKTVKTARTPPLLAAGLTQNSLNETTRVMNVSNGNFEEQRGGATAQISLTNYLSRILISVEGGLPVSSQKQNCDRVPQDNE